MRVFVLTIALFVSATLGAKFPSNWSACKLKDPKHNECLKNSIQKAIPDLVKGMPKLGITTVDPLRFEAIEVNQGTGPVSIELKFKNFEVSRTRNAVITGIQNDWKTLIANITAPLIIAKGDYDIKGKVLVLPITGKGKCELQLENFKATLTFKIKENKVKGTEYYVIDKLDMDLDCNPLRLKFDNLFNGNKQLGDQMNIFLNENWMEIFREVKPAFSQAFGQAAKELGNRVFARVPKNQITPP